MQKSGIQPLLAVIYRQRRIPENKTPGPIQASYISPEVFTNI